MAHIYHRYRTCKPQLELPMNLLVVEMADQDPSGQSRAVDHSRTCISRPSRLPQGNAVSTLGRGLRTLHGSGRTLADVRFKASSVERFRIFCSDKLFCIRTLSPSDSGSMND